MKPKWTKALLATTMLAALAGGVAAQTSAPAPAPARGPASTQPVFDPNQLPALDGSVSHFTLTSRGDVDGFVLGDGTQVHVPPHLSSELVAAVKPGDAVTIHGLHAAAIPMVAAMSVTNKATGQTVIDLGPAGGPDRGPRGRGPGGPPPPAAGPASEVSGKVLASLHGPRGELNGAMLDDGTTLHLPPPDAARLAALLAPGQTLVANGPGIANTLGRMIDVRHIGPSRDQLTQVQVPPHGPRGPDDGRRGPPPGGPGAPPPA